MIGKMTYEQEKQVPVYYDKFLKMGLSTDRLDVDKAVESIKALYRITGKTLDENPFIQVFDSPYAMIQFAEEETGISKSDFIEKIVWGNIESYWISFYAFINDVLEVKKEEERVNVIKDIASFCGPFLMFEKGILLSQRPISISMDLENKRLHNPVGPSVEYADGEKLYHLNGIKVLEKHVFTPPEDFTKDDILGEKNADVRREIVRRIPQEILVKTLDAKVIDSMDNYELLVIDLGDNRQRPFLKMINPSIEDVIHVEGVHPTCKTVEEALAWRNRLQKYKKPEVLA